VIDYTTEQLIKDAKREGSIPTDQSLYTNQDFVDTFTDCMKKRMIPNVLRTREEHFVHAVILPITASNRYGIPQRAIGGRIRGAQLLDAAGKPTIDLQRVEPEVGDGVWDSSVGYFFENNEIVLTEAAKSSTSLRIKFYRRPSKMVTTLQAGKVISSNPTTGEMVLDKIPAGMAIGSSVDLVGGLPPFNTQDSVAITNVLGYTITVAPEVAALVSPGDWACFEGESTIPQIPEELHPILTQYAVVKILKSLGDKDGFVLASSDLAEMERNLYEMLDTRDDGSSRKVVTLSGLWGSDEPDWTL